MLAFSLMLLLPLDFDCDCELNSRLVEVVYLIGFHGNEVEQTQLSAAVWTAQAKIAASIMKPLAQISEGFIQQWPMESLARLLHSFARGELVMGW